MEIETLWKRYAAIWSLDVDARSTELTACLSPEIVYCDPNGTIEGQVALSEYMGGFQDSAPGARFEIRWVRDHHDRSLAHWELCGPDDRVLQTGTSFGLRAPDGRLRSITGFFHPEGDAG